MQKRAIASRPAYGACALLVAAAAVTSQRQSDVIKKTLAMVGEHKNNLRAMKLTVLPPAIYSSVMVHCCLAAQPNFT